MARVILEITDGLAEGPIHQPVRQDINKNLFADVEPLEWATLCGSKGIVYDRDGVASLGFRTECFDCLVVLHGPEPKSPEPPRRRPIYNPGPTRYETEEERRAARAKTSRTYYDRTKNSRRGVCVDCGGVTSWSRGKKKPAERCNPCYRVARRAEHGTTSKYTSGCRCHACREATTIAARERRQAMRAWKEEAA